MASALSRGSRFVENLDSQFQSRPPSLALTTISESPTSEFPPSPFALKRPPGFQHLPSSNSVASLATLRPTHSRAKLLATGLEEEENDKADEGREGKVGLLEWLFCGCWGRADEDEQSSRTNPME